MKIRDFLKIEFIVPSLIIVVAFLGLLRLLPLSLEELTLTLLGFLAIDALLERTTFFRSLRETIHRMSLQRCLRSRLDPDFEDFRSFCAGGREIFVSALSLGFVAVQQRFVLEEGLRRGVSFRFLVVDPRLPDEAFQIIAEHDERSNDPEFAHILRNEIETALRILGGLQNIPGRCGHVEVKAARGLPVFTITMVDPLEDTGKMRVELRPYKRNQGARPYLELRKQEIHDRYWYDFFVEHYYKMLWEDSETILKY